MAITVRIGKENNFKADKLLPGEPAASLDAPKFRIGIGSGKCLELATVEQLQEILNASEEEYQSFQEFVKYLKENPNAYDAVVAQLEKLSGQMKITQYTSWQDLGLVEGEAGIEDIFTAMANNSIAVLTKTNDTDQGEFPYKWGLLTVVKSGRNRSSWEYSLNNGGNVIRRWVGGYSESMEPKWTGWEEVVGAATIKDKTKLTQYTSFGDLGLKNTATYEEIFNAMATPSYAILSKSAESVPESPISPTQSGLLIIQKFASYRSDWTFLIVGKNGLCKKYIGGYTDTITPKFTGWKEIITPSSGSALADQYVSLTNFTRLTENNVDVFGLTPGNYWALGTPANTLVNVPEGLTFSQAYITMKWDYGTSASTSTKRIELMDGPTGRKWFVRYNGTSWGTWFEYPAIMNPPAAGSLVQWDGSRLSQGSESGTWTPTLAGSDTSGAGVFSYTTQKGTYYKLGNLVYLSGDIRGTIQTAPTGYYNILGVPFTCSQFPQSSIVVSFSSGGQAESFRNFRNAGVNGDKLELIDKDGYSAIHTKIQCASGNNFAIVFSGWYQTEE